MDLTVKVVPRSAKSEVIGPLPDGTLKVRIAAVPEKGKANAALCQLLARHFGVALRDVRLLSGAGSSRKRIRIAQH